MNTQDVVFNAIEHHPCLHFRALLKLTGLAVGQLQHHIYQLLRNEEVVSFRLFRHTRYCLKGINQEDRVILGVLQLPVCSQIILHILEHDGEHCRALNQHLTISPSTLSWYITRLEQAKILTKKRHGKQKCLHVLEPYHVQSILEEYKESLFDCSVHGFMDAWRPR
jgi:predicted transcriptional regulator